MTFYLEEHFRGQMTWLCLALCACGHTSAAQKPAEPPTPVASTPEIKQAAAPIPARTPEEKAPEVSEPHGDEYVRDVMNDHFIITKLARDAVIVGDFASAREPVAALADFQYSSELPQAWQSDLRRLQHAARQTADAQDLAAAASGVAKMARVCGDCHLNTTGKAELGSANDPIAGRSESLDERMARHILALDRMWVGLTGPSDDAWREGAKLLVQAPAKVRDRASDLSKDFRFALREVRSLGTRAEHATDGEQRAEAYGQLLSTCARCHALHAAVEF